MQPGDRVPLFALLSQALVAFTIEFDNEFEHQAPHRTTRHGSTGNRDSAPWMVSMAMWLKLIRFVPDEGITLRDWKRAAGLTTPELRMWLTRIGKWWSIVAVDKRGAETPAEYIVRPTTGGRNCIAVWRPLAGAIEARWVQRFGEEAVNGLRAALRKIISGFDRDFSDYLPVLGYNLLTSDRHIPGATANDALPALLAKVLLAFAIEFESESKQSLAICANVLRLLENDIPLRELPRLSGLSKEAIAMAAKRIQEHGWAAIEFPPTGPRRKLLVLTPEGERSRIRYFDVADAIEERWAAAFGRQLHDLRAALDHLVGDGSPASLLFSGLKTYSDNWRASITSPEALPFYPMILHRGGYPDGS